MGEKQAEEIVLAELVSFMPAGATAYEIDRHMLQVGDDSVSLHEVTDALRRCDRSGDVERVQGVGLETYRITEKGRSRLRGEMS